MAKPLQIYELKIELLEIKPRIWRHFAVRSNRSLKVLHDIIQMVVGWKDCHLHEFNIDGLRYSTRYPELDDWSDRDVRDDRRVYLRDVLRGERFRFGYLYDFGDGWQHELEVTSVHPAEKKKRYPVCLAGERVCPPEDVGGSWGYGEMLEALADPNHEEHETYVEWLGGPFDREAFNLKEVNWMLKGIR